MAHDPATPAASMPALQGDSRMTTKLSMPRRAFCGGLAASAGLLAIVAVQRRVRADLSGPQDQRRDPDRPGRRRRAPRARLRRRLGQDSQDPVRIQLLPRRLGPDRLRAVRQAPPQGRAQPAVREHGSGNDHVYDPEAGLQFSARLHLFLDGRHRRQHHLREPDVAVQDHRAGRRRGEEAAAQRRREPDPASLPRSGCSRSAKRPSRATT